MKTRNLHKQTTTTVGNDHSVFNRLRSLIVVQKQVPAPNPRGFQFISFEQSPPQDQLAELEIEAKRASSQAYARMVPLR